MIQILCKLEISYKPEINVKVILNLIFGNMWLLPWSYIPFYLFLYQLREEMELYVHLFLGAEAIAFIRFSKGFQT